MTRTWVASRMSQRPQHLQNDSYDSIDRLCLEVHEVTVAMKASELTMVPRSRRRLTVSLMLTRPRSVEVTMLRGMVKKQLLLPWFCHQRIYSWLLGPEQKGSVINRYRQEHKSTGMHLSNT